MAKKKITVDDIKEAAEPEVKTPIKHERGDYLNTGCTLLNLALTNKHDCGFLPSGYYHLAGASQGAKTFLSSTCFAEANLNPTFDNYEFIYDNTERGNHINQALMLGQTAADRIRPPGYYADGTPKYSDTIESFYFHLHDALNGDKPCIYVLDSIDALSARADNDKFEEDKKAYENGKEIKGSYGMVRARKNSEYLRKVMGSLEKSNSILIIVSQTRDNLAGFTPSIAGGRSLKFYCTCQILTKPVGNIKKTVDGNEIIIGKNVDLEVKKNRLTGYEHKVRTAVYPSYGIADEQSLIQYLLDVKHWTKKKRSVVAPEFEFEGLEDSLIQKIQEEGREKELQMLAEEVWNKFLTQAAPKWKKRYA